MINLIKSKTWLADLLSAYAGIMYSLQTWTYAHSRTSILDEGAYLLKGYLFVTGRYQIYQDYGMWSNHMPLSFYLPGLFQVIFGPGLRTGRYLAIFLGLLMLVGLWLFVRRLAGPWWAAAILAVIAINPVMIKMYSVMVSQVIVACFLVWTLYLVAAPRRKPWEIALGSVLAGLTLLTRINLTPFFILVIAYIFWQHGRKAGYTALAFGGLTVLTGHALFWPGILRMWAYWIPDGLAPFLDPWRPPAGAIPFWDPDIGLDGRLLSFFSSFRVSFVALAGGLSAWLLWPRRANWPSRFHFRTAVFLSLTFLVEMLAHMWATLTKNYCVFCLPGYTLFFSATGLALLALTFPLWRKRISILSQIIIAVLILVAGAGIGFAGFEVLGNRLREMPVPNFLLFWTSLGDNQAEVSLELVISLFYDLEPGQLRRILPTLAGLGAGIAILLTGALITLLARRYMPTKAAFGYWALIAFLLAGALLTPTPVLGGGYAYYECTGDVLDTYERVGQYLAGRIPPQSKVYWQGGLSVVPLLYVPGIEIYPPQINGDYSFFETPESDALLRFGFWNRELAEQWLREADYILIRPRDYEGWLYELVNSDAYAELPPSPVSVTCQADSHILIFRRIQ